MKNILCLMFILAAAAGGAEETLFRILPNHGLLTLENDISLHLRYQGKNGELVSQKGQAFDVIPKTSRNSMNGKGIWNLPPKGSRAVETEISAEFSGSDGILRYALNAAEPVASRQLELQISLPVNRFSGQEFRWNGSNTFRFPEKFSTYSLKTISEVKEFQLPLSGGTITFRLSRPCAVRLSDNRKNKSEEFFVHVALIPQNTPLARTELTVRTEYKPFQTFPVPLNEAANSTFADEDPNDRQGGWTDQGANQDLRDFPTGKILKSEFAEFQILSAETNRGKECIVLGGGGRSYLPKTAVQNFPTPLTMKTLLLLHATAWTKGEEIGSVKLTFTDGSEHRIPIVGNRDVGDWWNPSRVPNALVGYHRRNDENESGLYLSAFPVPEKPIRRMEFRSTGISVWMIGAAAGSPDSIKLSAPKHYQFTRNNLWRESQLDHTILPGSLLDFSFIREAPAGKCGKVVIRDGIFSFEKAPEKRIRFYGTNLCTLACTLPKEKSKLLVQWLKGTGYNAIRLHQFDRELVDRKLPKNSLAFDEENIDNMDYLISLLKENGFYIFLDLFALRDRKPGEFRSAPDLRELKDMKLGIMVNPEIRENFKTFVRKFLGHKNKYTGLPLAQDPVLAGICIINENMIVSLYDDCSRFGKNGGESYRFCNRLFEEHCRKTGKAPTGHNRRAMMIEFLYSLYSKYFQEIKTLLQDELKLAAPLTDQNHRQPPLAAMLRDHYDFVDNHIYWDHPGFIGKTKWVPPYRIRNKSLLSGGLWPICSLAPSRIFGKPFTVTEFNVGYPNQFRADSGLVFGAFAAFQDWDGLFRFDYAHPNAMFGNSYPGSFSTLNDPVRTLSDSIGALLFIRGDLNPAKETLPLIVRRGEFQRTYVESYPKEMQELAPHVRTGTLPVGQALPEDSMTPWTLGKPAPASVRKAMKIRPAEIRMNSGKNIFGTVTPRLESVALPQGNSFEGKNLHVKSTSGFYSVVAAAAMDGEGKSLDRSDRILLFFLTDLRQEGILFSSEECNVVLKNPPRGNPILVRKGTAEISLKLMPGEWKATALDHSGKPLGSVPLRLRNGRICLNANNFHFPGNVIFAYELKTQTMGESK